MSPNHVVREKKKGPTSGKGSREGKKKTREGEQKDYR